MNLKALKIMPLSDQRSRWTLINKILAIMLMLLTVMVGMPLAIKTYIEAGGPWGFGIIGLHVLLPLNAYLLFAISALVTGEKNQWRLFVSGHLVSLCIGLVRFFVFPVLPKALLLIPALLAIISILNRKNLHIYLCLMILLAVIANVVLLKWELDFDRTIPLLELFQ